MSLNVVSQLIDAFSVLIRQRLQQILASVVDRALEVLEFHQDVLLEFSANALLVAFERLDVVGDERLSGFDLGAGRGQSVLHVGGDGVSSRSIALMNAFFSSRKIS